MQGEKAQKKADQKSAFFVARRGIEPLFKV